MKKLLSIGLLAACAFTLSAHNAQAWVNSKFSIGLNWHHQSANTSYLWGLWRNGQIPGPEAFGPGGAGGPGVAPGMPYGPPPQGQAFPYLGQNGMPQQAAPQGAAQGAFQPGLQQGFQGYPQNYPQTLPANLFQETAPPPQNTAQYQPYYNPNQGWNGSNPFQSVSYQSNNYGYGYYQPSYYAYPTNGYAVPYYWYGSR